MSRTWRLLISLALLSLNGCGGGGSGAPTPPPVQTFTVGGSVSGLSGVVSLQNNGKDTLSVQASGAFAFATQIAAGNPYAVTVLTQPADQTCKVDSGAGTVSAAVTSVAISCTKNQYAIGGTASGLVRPITLQDNLGDNLTVSADGAFVFPGKIDARSAYSVTILSPPPGLVCTVSAGSGTATADVSNVSVNCSADPDVFFIPLKAVGQYAGPPSGIYIGPWPPPTLGTNALIAVASDAIGAPPTTIVKGLFRTIGVSQKLQLGYAGAVTGGALRTLVYATEGETGGDHVWAVDLAGGSDLVPRQLGSLTVPFSGVFTCTQDAIYQNLNDPDSVFFILGLPPDPNNRCGGGRASFNNVLIRLSDGASTAPRQLPAMPQQLLPLYDPAGALAGFVTVDATNRLVFYADVTFTNPKVLLGNVTAFAPLQAAPVSTLSGISSTPGTAMVVTYAPDFSQRLYRVDYTGTLSADLYDFQTGWNNELQDSVNLYFTDNAFSNTGQLLRIMRAPLDGSAAAQVLYTVPAGPPGSQPIIVSSNGSSLILSTEPVVDVNSGAVTTPGALLALPVGTPGQPRTIVSLSSLYDVQSVGGDLYVNLHNFDATPAYAVTYSTESVALDGTLLQPVAANTSYLYTSLNETIQVRGITDPGGLGGGRLYATEPVVLADGSPFQVPAKVGSINLSPLVGSFLTGAAGYPGQTVGIVYDGRLDVIAPISMPHTDVTPLMPGF